MVQDLRYAARALLRARLVTVAAVVTLSLGIGAATAVFTVVDAVVLRPLPFPDADRLVRIWELTRDGARFPFSEPAYLELAAESRTLMHAAAYRDDGGRRVLADGGEPERITAVAVSASLGDVLGVRPRLGRMFTAEEDRPGTQARHVVLSDALWRRRFAEDPRILGRGLTLDGAPYTVAGVMPPGVDFPGGADAWIPLAADPTHDPGDKWLAVIGRLAPGATLAHLESELRETARRAADRYPGSYAGWGAAAAPFSEWIVAPRFRDALWILSGAVGLLLLLACANVAHLLIAQAVSRQGEIRIRRALGASRARLVRQLITESALLAALGTGGGVFLAVWSVDAVRALGSGRVPRLEQLQIDLSVLVFACMAGAASCLLFGLAPALHAARGPAGAGAGASGRHTGAGRRMRALLVVAEVALALLLLVSAGLMANSFVRLVTADAGFATAGTLAVPVEIPPARYAEPQAVRFYHDLLERLRAVPGVAGAGATSTNPFRESGFSNSVTPEERAAEAPPSGLIQAGWRSVTPGFFEALRIPVLRGRTFDAGDRAGAERVVVVSETLARRLWPGESPIGKRIFWGGVTGQPRTVVGVSGDIRDVQLDADPPPMLFVPHGQVAMPAMTVVIRTASGVAGVAPEIREIVRSLDASLPAPPVHEIAASRADASAGTRFNVALLAAFALTGVALAATGVYAMLAFTVSERRREIAVRLALGATGAQIAGFVLRSGFVPALVGILAGSAAALALTRLLQGLLYGVGPTDPPTFAAAAAALAAIAALASCGPARQAARVDAAAILRE